MAHHDWLKTLKVGDEVMRIREDKWRGKGVVRKITETQIKVTPGEDRRDETFERHNGYQRGGYSIPSYRLHLEPATKEALDVFERSQLVSRFQYIREDDLKDVTLDNLRQAAQLLGLKGF